MADKFERVSIGFMGTQVLSLRVTADHLDALLKALDGGGWHDLEADDGTVRLNLGQIIYVRTDREQHRVGFGL
jgi:hypothetical protein